MIRTLRRRSRQNGWFVLLRNYIAEDLDRRGNVPDLTIPQIRRWAKAYHARTGRWPTWKSGPIPEGPGETWLGVQAALYLGVRGVTRRTTLARFLKKHLGVAIRGQPPNLSQRQILRWADAHFARTGTWPTAYSGRVFGAPGENWQKIDAALRNGSRTLSPGSSLARLLAERRGVPNQADRPRLKIREILAWADAYHRRIGSWPTKDSGPVPESDGDTWMAVDRALRDGTRSMTGGSSLARLLAKKRGHRNIHGLPPLTIPQILAWADARFEATGQWPTAKSGRIPGTDETWGNISQALRLGLRELTGGSSLARLLAEHRGVRNRKALPSFNEDQIFAWQVAHHARTGAWPTTKSGPVLDAPGETWLAVEMALRDGRRHLTGGSSLAKLRAKRLGRSRTARWHRGTGAQWT